MRWSLFKFVAVFILTLTTTAFCQIRNLDFTGGGARAEGMGKAFLGISDDISAVSWNPAGLYVHNKPMLGISYGLFMPRGNYAYRGTTLDQTGSFNKISYIGFLSSLRIKGHHFVGAISYSKALDEFFSTAFDSSFTYINPFGSENNAWYREASEYSGGPYQLCIGFGTRIYKNISFGFSTNIYTGKYFSEASSYLALENMVTGDSYNQEIFYEENISVIDTTRFSGVNFTLGFKYNTDKIESGLVFKTPYDLKVTTDESIYFITMYNGKVKPNWTDTVYNDDVLQKFEIPLIVGLGGGYHLNENLLLAMDMEYRPYQGQKIKQRTDYSIKPGGEKEETYVETDPLWQDVFTLRMGAEYKWHTGFELFPVVPLRLGFAYLPLSSSEIKLDTITIRDTLYQITTTSKTTFYNFSAGLGVHWTQIYLDLAYTYSTNDYKNYILGNNQVLENRYHHLNLTFTGYF
ncbi:MAG: hypothetical protein PHU88_00605 [candidate division Zixibacteria bacterium]|nr:hypothetical protein [candidate division Zixibacteria bacterium]